MFYMNSITLVNAIAYKNKSTIQLNSAFCVGLEKSAYSQIFLNGWADSNW